MTCPMRRCSTTSLTPCMIIMIMMMVVVVVMQVLLVVMTHALAHAVEQRDVRWLRLMP